MTFSHGTQLAPNPDGFHSISTSYYVKGTLLTNRSRAPPEIHLS